MARKHSVKKPSFFKVLIGDFSKRLRIPLAFIKNFNGPSLHKCLLRDPSRRLWNVELEQRENGWFFCDGWQVFVKDHLLQVGNFLVFSYDGESKFNVRIYDRSGCEKDVEVAERRRGSPVSLENKVNQAEAQVEIIDLETDSQNYDEDCEHKASFPNRRTGNAMSENNSSTDSEQGTSSECISFKSKNSCFVETLKNYQLTNLTIPRKIATDERLSSTKERDVMVLDKTGKSWPVTLKTRPKSSSYRVDMTAGWKECCRGNQISAGDTVVFEFVKQSLIQIHIFPAVRGKRFSVVLDAS